MYRPNITELQDFYSTTLGHITCKNLQKKIKEIWCEEDNNSTEYILGIGYTDPYLLPFQNNKKYIPISILPSEQEVINRSIKNNCTNISLISKETMLPFDDSSIDKVILSHALEFTEHQAQIMDEIWRILSPQGRLLIIVPNRLSIWSRVESTPFGHGHPFSPRQLDLLLMKSMFIRTRLEMELFMPPTNSKIILKMSEIWEKLGKIFLNPLGGVLIIEAEKRIFSPITSHKTINYKNSGLILTPAIQSRSQLHLHKEK